MKKTNSQRKCYFCDFWSGLDSPDDSGEFFSFFNFAYDIDKAREIFKNNFKKLKLVETEKLLPMFTYELKGKRHQVAKIDKDHVNHVPFASPGNPIIIAWSPRTYAKGGVRFNCVIDGNHRLAKSIKHKHSHVWCIHLTQKETDKICYIQN